MPWASWTSYANSQAPVEYVSHDTGGTASARLYAAAMLDNTPDTPIAAQNATLGPSYEKSSPCSSILSFTRSSSVVFHLSNLLI